MKVNSKGLYDYINDLAFDEKVKFKVYYDDNYVTQIYWNGESFEWDTGTFTSEAFFNPLYDFIVIEEDKTIERLPTNDGIVYATDGEMLLVVNKINEIIDKINEMENKQCTNYGLEKDQ